MNLRLWLSTSLSLSFSNSSLRLLLIQLAALMVAAAVSRAESVSLSDPGSSLRRYDSVSIIYYDLDGETVQALQEQMARIGPVDRFNRRREAYTHWFLKWAWPSNGQGVPQLNAAQVDVEIIVTLPRWFPPEPQSEAAGQWERYLRAVVAHEKGHIESALNGADTLKRKLRSIPRGEWNAAAASRLARSVVSKLHRFDREYDQRTDSGRKEGVVLSRQEQQLTLSGGADGP